jgi:signal transduction histidine kinase
MGKGEKGERRSTDASLKSERRKTDAELANRSEAIQDIAIDVVTEAREKADSVLSDARALEDSKSADELASVPQTVRVERAREDAVINKERRGADVLARDEIERHRVALASLLAYEREDTDLRLEIERKRADRELTTREDFMAMVSHDLRSLLGGIALGAELLKDVETEPEPFVQVGKYADRIQRFTARMTRLVGDLMDVASIETGKLSLVLSRRNPTMILGDALDAFAPAAAAHEIELVCESSVDPKLSVQLDHERILQVLTNLVGNALKFTARGGQITIRVVPRDQAVEFSVTDTGVGVPTELLERIFERYFQSESGDRRGLGLGLYIARSIVEAHGGQIWATSTLGSGSAIHFTVPLAH